MEPGAPPVVANLAVASTANKGAVEQQIDPWSVSAAIDDQGNTLAFDYEAISRKWNTSLIDEALLARFERLTGHKPHRWLRRGLFFSHRDFDRILDCYERGDRFLIYTGRGPSSDSMHIGHTIPFEFTKWLQDVFDMPLVIMLTDDEKYLFKESLSVEDTMRFAEQNAKDILAVGFDLKKTFVYSDFHYMGGHFYQNAIEFAKLLPTNQVRGAFGFDGTTNIGRVFFPSVQCVAAFATSYPLIWGDSPDKPRQKRTAAIPCLIPCAIDQDPYFRLLRDNAHRMKLPSPKPALIHSKFLTALQGAGGKMSASDATSAIFMSDTKAEVKKKINKYAFSGGGATLEEHRANGGNPNVDVPFQYLTYFLDDDAELERIRQSYISGELLTGEMKQLCISIMQEYVEAFQSRRKAVTDDLLKQFMTPRKLEWRGNPNPIKVQKGAAPTASASQPPSQASTQKLPIRSAPVSDLQAAQAQAMQASQARTLQAQPDMGAPVVAQSAVSSPPTQPNTSTPPLSLPAQPPTQMQEGTAQVPADPTDAPSFSTASQTAQPQAKPRRPGLDALGRTSSYGVRGLSGYGESVVSMLYGGQKGSLHDVEE